MILANTCNVLLRNYVKNLFQFLYNARNFYTCVLYRLLTTADSYIYISADIYIYMKFTSIVREWIV